MNIMNYNKGQGPKKNWILEEASFDERCLGKCEAVFCQGNGYLGLRNSLEEQYVGTTRNLFAAGTFNKASAAEVTELPNLPDLVNMEIQVNGERFSLNRGTVTEYSRTLDLQTGETLRRVRWVSPAGDPIALSFHRFVSLADVHVIGSRVEITPLDADVTLQIKSGINAMETNHGAQHFCELDKRVLSGGCLEYPVITTQSGVTAVLHTVHKISDPAAAARTVNDRRTLHRSFTAQVRKGETLRLEKISAVSTTRDLEYASLPETEAAGRLVADGRERIAAAAKAGYDALFENSRAAWAAFWDDQDIRIEGDDWAQLAIRFALYHLRIMTRREDGRIGIAAKGLSGEGYKGHSFWDTETFIFPYFQFADPDTARTLLDYRYRGLYGARLKARENGYVGAMYPWESAWISDGEVTPTELGVDPATGETLYCLTGKLELHITCDIIYALWQYYLSTGDDRFMEDCGYEMILEAARFWNSRLEWIPEKDRYEIRDVIGPDEYKEHVDNNAYTNYMTAYTMGLAVQAIDKLAANKALYDKLSSLDDLAALKEQLLKKQAKLYLPKPDPETGIIPQFEGYMNLKDIDLTPYKQASVVGTFFNDYSNEDVQHLKVGKQADVVELLYQLEDLVSPEIKRKNYLYYESKTLHDSSLSKAIHSVTACDLGMEAEAYDMFKKASATDMGPEMRSSDAGIHSANMGGIWQDVVMGFGGLRISEGRLRIAPHLPRGWQTLSYPVCWHGSRLQVTVTPEEIRIRNNGKSVEVLINGEAAAVAAGENTWKQKKDEKTDD